MQMMVESFASLNIDWKIILKTQQYHFIKQTWELLYPHYQKLIPAIMIVQWNNTSGKSQLINAYVRITLSAQYFSTTFSICYPGKITPASKKDIFYFKNSCGEQT